MTFLPLAIRVRGEVLTSNVSLFREKARLAIRGLNLDLRSDEDFGEAEQNVKGLQEAEDRVRTAKRQALSDAEQLQALFAELDATGDDLRDARLTLERQIQGKKEEVRRQLIAAALEQFTGVPPELAQRTFAPVLEAAIRGRRTLAGMEKALEAAVRTQRVLIGQSRQTIERFVREHGGDLVMDRRELEVRRPDLVAAELQRRLDLREAVAGPSPQSTTRAEIRESEGAVPGPAEASAAISTAAELEIFRARCREAFGPLKAAREAVCHPENVRKVALFAAVVNQAWKEVA